MKGSGSSSNNNQLFQGVDFPVNLNRRDDNHDHDEHHDHNGDHEGSHKVVVGEVDFFSEQKSANNRMTSPHRYDHHHVKDENSTRDHHHHPAPATGDPSPDLLHVNTGLHLLTTNTGSDQSTVDDSASSDVEDKRAKNELAVLQAELELMNTENQKLKSMLSQVSHNYSALQVHFVTLMQQQQQQLLKGESTQQHEVMQAKAEERKNIVPRQFLDLGPSSKNNETDEMTSHTLSDDERNLDGRSGSPQNKESNVSYDHGKGGSGHGREDSPEDSDWVPNKAPKLNPPRGNSSPVDQAAAEATMRKARVSVRARSEAPMISDGCQWRKYGQKMAKGNPCPRAYYRCTMAVGCPVRKQVQRCAEDRSILITTYEGNHNHPLPAAAMAMASTTSAAASMLLSGSMPSGDALMNPNFLARTILPCSSSMATISASAPFPTVTLDLTHSPNPLQLQQRPPHHVPQQSAPNFQVPFPPSNGQLPSNFLASLPQIFGQVLNNNNNNNQSKFSGLHTSSSSSASLQGLLDAAHLQSPNQNTAFSDTLSAATAAITSDPNFTAALAAAISSIMGGARPGENNIANNAPGNSPSSGATTSGNNVNSSSSMQQ